MGSIARAVCALRGSEVARTVAASMLGAAAFVFCERFTGTVAAGPPLVGAAIAAVAVLVLRWRFGRWLKQKRSHGMHLRTVILVGTNEDGKAIWNMLTDEPELGYRIGAVLGEHRVGEPWGSLPVCNETNELVALAEQVHAGGIIVVASALSPSDCSDVVSRGSRSRPPRTDVDGTVWSVGSTDTVWRQRPVSRSCTSSPRVQQGGRGSRSGQWTL